MNCIIDRLIWDILGRRLLGSLIPKRIKVADDVEVHDLHVGVYCLHQLLQDKGIFIINYINLALNGRSEDWAWNLLQVPQRRILGHSQRLEGSHSSFLEPMDPSLVDICEAFDIYEAFIVPLAFTGLKGHL